MTNKKIDLIDSLVDGHKKISSAPSILSRLVKWIIVCVISVSIGIAILGLRSDWQVLFSSPVLFFQNVFILLSSGIVGYFAISSSRPQNSLKVIPAALGFLLIGLWSAILFVIGWKNGHSLTYFDSPSPSCVVDILVISIVPSIFLVRFLNQGAVLLRATTGFLTLLAAFVVGGWASQFTCSIDDPIHLFLWHVLPIVFFSLLGLKIGSLFFRKI